MTLVQLIRTFRQVAEAKVFQFMGRLKHQPLIPVLCYHSVDETGALGSARPEEFRSQMRYLKEKGYKTAALSDLVRILAMQNQRPRQKNYLMNYLRNINGAPE